MNLDPLIKQSGKEIKEILKSRGLIKNSEYANNNNDGD